MVSQLIETLESLGYPVYRQGSLTGEYPPSFFTFWNPDTVPDMHYDDNLHAVTSEFTVFFYSANPALVWSELGRAAEALRAKGFAIPVVGYDVPSDEQSHIGRALRAYYKQTKKESEA